jgi:hypothetical protein
MNGYVAKANRTQELDKVLASQVGARPRVADRPDLTSRPPAT